MQGHVDMVTEKNNDVEHDFFKDPLCLQSDGTWLKVGPMFHTWASLHCSIGVHAVIPKFNTLPDFKLQLAA